jgi:radical SAM family RiPP maturation amino acid epimerase
MTYAASIAKSSTSANAATPDGCRSELNFLYGWLGALSLHDRRLIGAAKQAAEWLMADAGLRRLARTAPAELDAAFAARGIAIDPAAVRPLWDPAGAGASDHARPAIALYDRWQREMANHRAAIRMLGGTATPPFGAWRRRMVARAQGSLAPQIEREIVHAAAAFELASGCSVGCGFCALGAGRLTAVATYDPPTARLWGGMLEALEQTVGPAAATAFAYWATDPFDTPDYPAFVDAFADRFGHLPPTTTARGTDDIELTRRLIEQLRERGGGPFRVSILTTKQLRRLHAAIPLEDLPFVATAIQTRGAATYRIVAGRMIERGTALADDASGGEGTIACITGFLVNLPERRVRLVSPCVADRHRPNGYRVHDERPFRDAAEFADVLAGMVAAAMPLTLAGGAPAEFRPGLSPEAGDPLLLRDRHAHYRLADTPLMRALVPLLVRGGTCAEAERALVADGHFPFAVKTTLQALFDHGLLADELDVRDGQAANPEIHR